MDINIKQVKAYGANSASKKLEPMLIERREPKKHEVLLKIEYCGICHSDVHQARSEWGESDYPMVPGHEITGIVVKVGEGTTKFKLGDKIGVGTFVDSCRQCKFCLGGDESYCIYGLKHGTYAGVEKDGFTPTQGGYSRYMTVNEDYAFVLPEGTDLAETAPLLCAGITTFAPLRRYGVTKGTKVGVSGLGGLGHMAVQLATAMGAEVTVLSRGIDKREYAKSLGAKDLVSTQDKTGMEKIQNSLELIIDTVSAEHSIDELISLLKTDGKLVLVGIPNQPLALSVMPLVAKRISVVGSLIGGLALTQEMLNFCAQHKISAKVEKIPVQKINEAFDQLAGGHSGKRYVIDAASFDQS
ncbi:unnamed protein product [Didymodactylos carnosus]|uniref:Enoyl reductase (ER) domain-containing protein n=1 Tax=Didymodactylos carnosus TaxID=1234261 RepID=A0A8S2CUA0_9BILA|nr:unnamed protein product [Didymodactylos carnosus]CAF3588537.1 unnamed protein product [Didymodactylos carnosus]